MFWLGFGVEWPGWYPIERRVQPEMTEQPKDSLTNFSHYMLIEVGNCYNMFSACRGSYG